MICYMCMRVYEGTRCPYCGFSPDTYEPFPTVLLPTTILANRYYIGAVLGKGGFGITYIGYDIAARRKVAVKEYFPSAIAFRDGHKEKTVSVLSAQGGLFQSGVEKFYNEAVTLARFTDIPAIVQVYDFFYENNTAYIVMEYIDGTSVEQIVVRQGGLDIDMVLTIYFPIIQALAGVHNTGLLHRDISPSNVMLDEYFRPRLIDFGSSRAFSHEMSSDLTVILKKGFAPIEQYSRRERHGPAEDVYAICASMYYTLTGKVPPAAPDRSVFDTLQPIHAYTPDIPPELENIILRGMAVRAADRYPDMQSLADAIDAAVLHPQRAEEVHAEENNGGRKESTRGDNGLPMLALLISLGIAAVVLLSILIWLCIR